jgi:alanine-glyoxylate transaminase/serine-glyoxylate transaminase/serine-pyruvate transaminase
MEIIPEVDPSTRALLGPGPSPVIRASLGGFIREIQKIGLEPAVPEKIRAPMINAVRIPPGVDDAQVRQRLYDEFNIEIGAGLGPLKGTIWRVGLMGHGARVENVEKLVIALWQLM